MKMIKETGRGHGASDPAYPDPGSALLLREMNHRVLNEVAAALAAIRLACGRRGRQPDGRLMDRAIERLEGFGETIRILGTPLDRRVDVKHLLDRLCSALLSARGEGGRARLVFDSSPLVVERSLARVVLLVANELVTNALKHALSRGGSLLVRLEVLASSLVLSVIDDGPGLGAGEASLTSGTRLGGSIVGELVRGAGGSLDCDSGLGGTTIHVILPLAPGDRVFSGD